MTTVRGKEECVKSFNASVKTLLTRLERKTKDEKEIADLDRLKSRIGLLKSTMGDSALLTNSIPFFMENSEKILQPAEQRDKFLFEMDIRKEYLARGHTIKKQDEFIFTLTDSIRGHYKRARETERNEMYECVRSMLTCCIEYQMN